MFRPLINRISHFHVHFMKRKHSTSPLPSPKKLRTTMGPSIQLNAREQKLKSLLLDVAAHVDKLPQRKEADALVLRWAGGWVRDKLLGIESNDIDTAINSMTGFPFAQHISDYCNNPENVQNHGLEASDIGGLHRIAANPEKSKHLETTTVRMFDLDVDFVNLRKETYADDSRNPVMEFGTAEEDALRRDATVNALFYNLHTGHVEDFTGGVQDMRDKVMRTPMEPLKTFTDDPLRVLRLVRFASRLQFTIAPETVKWMANEQVLEALRLKISRERVGNELEKMLKGQHPRESLDLIERLGLYHAIFTDPTRPEAPKPDITNWRATFDCLDYLANSKTPGSIYDVLVRTEEAAVFAWMLTAAVPFEQFPEEQQYLQRKPRYCLAAWIFQEGVKSVAKLSGLVEEGHKHRKAIAALKEAVCNNEAYINERDRFGMAVREWDARKSWRLQVLYAVLEEVFRAETTDREEILSGWQKFLDHLQELDVVDAPNLKRLVDGKQMSKALGIKSGPWMSKALDVATAWQLRHPDETDPAGAVEEVRQRAEELGIPLEK